VRLRPVRLFLVAMLALLFGLSAASAATPGKITKERFDYGGRSISYYLFVPKSLSAQAPAPVILLLHGSGRNGSSLAEPWKDLAGKECIVLVAPDAIDPGQWKVPDDGPAAFCALLDELRRTLPIDPHRLYLFGHSGGAVFALYMSILEPEYFAATFVHAGALRSEQEIAGLSIITRPIPIGIVVGDQDPFFPAKDVAATVDGFKARGVPIQAEIIKGHNHNYYDVSSRVNASAWAFLRGRSLDTDPKYVDHQIR
jgi:poly(3-hydroxybutyrate) depolymerase